MLTLEKLDNVSFLQSQAKEIYLSVVDLFIKNYENHGTEEAYGSKENNFDEQSRTPEPSNTLSSSGSFNSFSFKSVSTHSPFSPLTPSSPSSSNVLKSIESLNEIAIPESLLIDLIIQTIIKPSDSLQQDATSSSFQDLSSLSSNFGLSESKKQSSIELGSSKKHMWDDSNGSNKKVKGFLYSILRVKSKQESISETSMEFHISFRLSKEIRDKYFKNAKILVNIFVDQGLIQYSISSKSIYFFKTIPKICNNLLGGVSSLFNPYLISLSNNLDSNSILLAYLQDPKFIYFIGLQNEVNFLAHVAFFKQKADELESLENYKQLDQFMKSESRVIYKSRVKSKRSDKYMYFGRSPSAKLSWQTNSIKNGEEDSPNVVPLLTLEQRQSIKEIYKRPSINMFDELYDSVLLQVEKRISQHIQYEDDSCEEIFSLEYYVNRFLIDNTTSVLQLYEQMKIPMLKAMRTHLKKEYSIDILIFYEQALAFQNETNVWIRKTRFQDIFLNFLSENTSTPINISSQALKHCRSLYISGNCSPDSLKPAIDEVLLDLNQNFHRYLSVGEFAESVLKEIRDQFSDTNIIYTPYFVKLCLAGREFSLSKQTLKITTDSKSQK